MRRRWIMAAALALTGCGARSAIPGPGSEPEVDNAFFYDRCGEMALTVGAIDCPTDGKMAPESAPILAFVTYSPVDADPGAVFEVFDKPQLGPGQANGSRQSATSFEPFTGGTLDLTTYVRGESATGWYNVQFEGGEASGTFG